MYTSCDVYKTDEAKRQAFEHNMQTNNVTYDHFAEVVNTLDTAANQAQTDLIDIALKFCTIKNYKHTEMAKEDIAKYEKEKMAVAETFWHHFGFSDNVKK